MVRRSDGAIGRHGDKQWPPGNCAGWGQQPQQTMLALDEQVIAEVIRDFIKPGTCPWAGDLAHRIALKLKDGKP